MGVGLNEAAGDHCVTDFPFHLRTPVAKQSLSYGWSIWSAPPRQCRAPDGVAWSGRYNYYTDMNKKKRERNSGGDFKWNSVKLGSNEACPPPPNGSSVLFSWQRSCWRSSRKNVPFSFPIIPIQAGGRDFFFPSPVFSHLCLHLK